MRRKATAAPGQTLTEFWGNNGYSLNSLRQVNKTRDLYPALLQSKQSFFLSGLLIWRNRNQNVFLRWPLLKVHILGKATRDDNDL